MPVAGVTASDERVVSPASRQAVEPGVWDFVVRYAEQRACYVEGRKRVIVVKRVAGPWVGPRSRAQRQRRAVQSPATDEGPATSSPAWRIADDDFRVRGYQLLHLRNVTGLDITCPTVIRCCP